MRGARQLGSLMRGLLNSLMLEPETASMRAAIERLDAVTTTLNADRMASREGAADDLADHR